jgi:hypothetical protein
MIRGIDSNRIIVGAYVDSRSNGVCPMLAAHRNGGRTDVASFARAWDEFTNARRPRRATRREVRALRALLTDSLDFDTSIDRASIAELAAQIRAEREAFRCAAAVDAPASTEGVTAMPVVEHPIEVDLDTGDRHRASELRLRPNRSWMRPARRLDEFKDLLAAAEEELSERRADEILGREDAPLASTPVE